VAAGRATRVPFFVPSLPFYLFSQMDELKNTLPSANEPKMQRHSSNPVGDGSDARPLSTMLL
jgi:hypothetical protein